MTSKICFQRTFDLNIYRWRSPGEPGRSTRTGDAGRGPDLDLVSLKLGDKKSLWLIIMFLVYLICTYVSIYMCVYVCMYVRTYVRTYVCMYVCMYVYIYIYAQPPSQNPPFQSNCMIFYFNCFHWYKYTCDAHIYIYIYIYGLGAIYICETIVGVSHISNRKNNQLQS